MLLLDQLDFVVVKSDLEHRNQVALSELGEDGTTDQVGESLASPEEVLLGLDDRQLVAASLSLHGQHEMSAGAVDGDVDLVHLDLANVFDCRSEVVLERIGGYA